MGLFDVVKRAGLAVATGGLSEAGGARTLYDGARAAGRAIQGARREDHRKEQLLEDETGAASRFADVGQRGFGRTGRSMDQLAGQLGRLGRGEDSFSAEQLRQNLGQTMAAQQAFAAGARPGNQAMAARTAAMNMGRQQVGLAGQQALAGIQERQAAQQALGQLLGTQRGQDLQAALGARQQALAGYGQLAAEPGMDDRIWGLAGGVAQSLPAVGAAAFSDKRVKRDIKDGSKDADEFLKSLKAYTYKYKKAEHGEGDQLGVMAQDIEKTKFGKQIVLETPQGKMLNAAKLSGANTAAIARLADRLSKLESSK